MEIAQKIEEATTALKRVSSKLDYTEDPDVRAALSREVKRLKAELLVLEEEKAKLKEVRETVPTQKAEILIPIAPTSSEEEEAEQLLRKAHIAQVQGSKAASLDFLKKAVETAPGSPSVLFAVAKSQMEQGRVVEAKKNLDLARKIDPTHRQVEDLHANAVYKLANLGSLEDQLRGSDGILPDGDFASIRSAQFMSALLPGLGHLVLGRKNKGIPILSVWIFLIIAISLMGKDLYGLFSVISGGRGSGGNMLVLLPLFLAMVIWLGTLADISLLSKQQKPKSVPRPTPPVNLPFD